MLANFKWQSWSGSGIWLTLSDNMQCNSGKEDADEMNITPSEHNGTKLDSKHSGMNI